MANSAAINRDFIQARCQAGESGGEILEKYRGRIVDQFFPARGFGKLKLGEARKAIRDYRKATGNPAANARGSADVKHACARWSMPALCGGPSKPFANVPTPRPSPQATL